MGKRIIFCADGTWDEPGKNTNVYKLYKALTTSADQVPYYDDGVGSDGLLIQKLAGGALGAGLFQKIKDGYTKIAHVYEKGDEVFHFRLQPRRLYGPLPCGNDRGLRPSYGEFHR